MAEEFVDLYELLELPLESDRNALRKRINEMYLDAQRNLDHRNFQTRVHYQKLFEVTLPQARYILLDEGRRADYDRLVASFRGSKTGGAPPAPSMVPTAPEPVDPNIPGATTAPEISPLPAVAPVDPAQLAAEREELWKKWKSGLEEAVKVDETPAPSPAPKSRASSAPRAAARSAAPTSAATEPVNFDFKEKTPSGNPILPPRAASRSAEDPNLSAEALERRRDHRRREIIKERLVTVGMTWGAIGAALVLVPGLMVMFFLSPILYPGVGNPKIPLPQPIFFLLGFVIFTAGAFFMGQKLSRDKRRKTVAELSSVPMM